LVIKELNDYTINFTFLKIIETTMEIIKDSVISIHISGDKEINTFQSIVEKTFSQNRMMGFNRNKLTTEESDFLEQIYQNIRK